MKPESPRRAQSSRRAQALRRSLLAPGFWLPYPAAFWRDIKGEALAQFPGHLMHLRGYLAPAGVSNDMQVRGLGVALKWTERSPVTPERP